MAYGGEVEKLERRWMENPIGVSFAPLAEAYRRAGDQARALELLAVGLANHPAYVPALIVQARCHLDVQADGAAEESFMAVLATDGHNLIALKGLADICERSDRPGLARMHLDRLLEADPTHDEGRAQMDRLIAVLADRETMHGETPAVDAPDEAATTVPAPDKAEGFEPTDAGSFDGPAALEEITLTTETSGAGLAEVVEESPVEASLVSDEDLHIEYAMEDAPEAESPPGLEVAEPDFELEREVAPFEVSDTEDAEARTLPAGADDKSLAVPFEEEFPADWHAQSPDESVPGPFREESDPDHPVPAEAASSETEEEPPLVEPDPVPEDRDPVWAPTGSLWAPESAEAPVEDAGPPAEEVPTGAASGDGVPAAEMVIEPEPDPGIPEAVEVWPWARQPVAESMSEPEAGPDAPEPALEADDIVESTAGTESWHPTAPGEAPAELPALSGTEDPERAMGSPAPESDDRLGQEPTLEAWGDSTDFAEGRPAETTSSAEDDREFAIPVPEASPAAPAADDEMVVVEGAAAEFPSDPEPEIEPALIMTETMARLFERQGHRTMALAIYAQLAEQAPGNPDFAAAVSRLADELSPASSRPGSSQPLPGLADRAALDAILGRGGSPSAPAARPVTDQDDQALRLDGPATRASEDLFSLSAVFGTARPGPAAQAAAFAPGSESGEQEPSFDEFFGTEETTPPGGARADAAGEEDLEQFTAWLRSLKR